MVCLVSKSIFFIYKQEDMVNMDNVYYTVSPAFKQVTKEQFDEFIQAYPRKLETDAYGVFEPPLISFNDFELASMWPYSIVAKSWGDRYLVAENYEEMFASRTADGIEKINKRIEERAIAQKRWQGFLAGTVTIEIRNENGETVAKFKDCNGVSLN